MRCDVEGLHFGYRTFTAHPDRILAERGLGRAHHRVLYFVRRARRVAVTPAGARLEAELTGAQTRLLDAVFAEIGTPARQNRRTAMNRHATLDG